MYKIYSDNLLIYDPTQPEYRVIDAQYNGMLNESGTLNFTIHEDHPHYGQIKLMKSIITLYDDNTLIFRGRPYAPNLDLYKLDLIECEGELAFFNDTYQEPFEYFGDVATLFAQVINFHNAQVEENKRFIVGNVTVRNNTQDGNIVRSCEDYTSTIDILRSRFFESDLGGYLYVRHEQDGNYIDYLEDLNFLCGQDVEQAINLLEVTKRESAEDMATVVIPLGAQLTDEDGNNLGRLTIESIHGQKYIESPDGITSFGRITKVCIHDDITTPLELYEAGENDLSSCMGALRTITLTAVDLSRAGYDIDPFKLGTYVLTKIQNLSINERMLLREININLLDPASNSITLGSEKRTLTQTQIKTTQTIEDLQIKINKSLRDQEATERNLIRETTALIENSSQNLMSVLTESYYNAEDTNQLVEQLQTIINQTAQEITFAFNNFVTEQMEVNGETAESFEEWRRYIRFVNGNIEIGIIDNPMMLRLEHNRIVFLEGGVEVAYWENRNFYAVDGEFLRSLRLGNFVFFPRESGNLSFFKQVQEVEPEPPEPPEGEGE